MKEVVTKLKLTCVSALTRQVLLALDNARLQIEALNFPQLNGPLTHG